MGKGRRRRLSPTATRVTADYSMFTTRCAATKRPAPLPSNSRIRNFPRNAATCRPPRRSRPRTWSTRSRSPHRAGTTTVSSSSRAPTHARRSGSMRRCAGQRSTPRPARIFCLSKVPRATTKCGASAGASMCRLLPIWSRAGARRWPIEETSGGTRLFDRHLSGLRISRCR